MKQHKDFAVFIPVRFVDAFRADVIDALHFGLACYVAALCFECRNTSGGVAVVRLSELAELFEVSVDTIGRKLHDLEPEWIECDVRPGQRAWRIRLTGLASPAEAPQNLRTTSAPEPPAVRSLTSASPKPPDRANRHAETDSHLAEPPQSHSEPEDTRPDPTRPTAVTEERLDQSRSEVRAERVMDDDRFLALFAESNEKKPEGDAPEFPLPGDLDFVERLLARRDVLTRDELLERLSVHRLTAPAVQGTLDAALAGELAGLLIEGVLTARDAA